MLPPPCTQVYLVHKVWPFQDLASKIWRYATLIHRSRKEIPRVYVVLCAMAYVRFGPEVLLVSA